jgi:fumarate hydratase subunit alpha
VKVEYAHTHTASLPVSVNLQCWAARRASVRMEGGEWEWR